MRRENQLLIKLIMINQLNFPLNFFNWCPLLQIFYPTTTSCHGSESIFNKDTEAVMQLTQAKSSILAF